jgi:hypothetical protein
MSMMMKITCIHLYSDLFSVGIYRFNNGIFTLLQVERILYSYKWGNMLSEGNAMQINDQYWIDPDSFVFLCLSIKCFNNSNFLL